MEENEKTVKKVVEMMMIIITTQLYELCSNFTKKTCDHEFE